MDGPASPGWCSFPSSSCCARCAYAACRLRCCICSAKADIASFCWRFWSSSAFWCAATASARCLRSSPSVITVWELLLGAPVLSRLMVLCRLPALLCCLLPALPRLTMERAFGSGEEDWLPVFWCSSTAAAKGLAAKGLSKLGLGCVDGAAICACADAAGTGSTE